MTKEQPDHVHQQVLGEPGRAGKNLPVDVAGDRAGDQPTRILPQLSVRRGRAAVEFYQAAFGAVEDYRVGGTDDDEDVVAQLSVGNASFWVSDDS